MIRQAERMKADGIGGGRRGYTLNETKRYDIATVWSPERKEASGIGGDRQEEDTHKHTPRHNITTVRQAERQEAGGIGGDRFGRAYEDIYNKKLSHHDSVASM